MTGRAKRSIAATPEGLKQITKKRETSGKTAEVIGDLVSVSRSSAQKFFSGKPIAVENFQKLCKELNLDWEEIAGLRQLEQPATSHSSVSPITPTELEALVQQARERGCKDIEKRCGTMRVLDMNQPIGLGAIYTDVNILEKITGKTRRDLAELMQGCTAENFDRFSLGEVREKRVDGLEAVQAKKQLMILGRPGAGKTTFLKRLATLCNQGEFLLEQVPIFVTLKEFAETINQPGLLDFITHNLSPQIEIAVVDNFLRQGRGLVLLDGLDEVLEKDHDRVLQEIREFARYYDQSHIIITCRIAAQEYVFEQFTDVEMADFNDKQIQDFADKWFKAKEPEKLDIVGKSTIAQLFWQALEEQKLIKELATNPLLLTLLCLEFKESSKFPQSRAELYERGLNILLRKWDKQRRIKRDEVYKGLPIEHKKIMLGHLAMHTFERGEYFFRTNVAEKQIGQYIQNLPNASIDPDALLIDSHAVLKSIESQHGLLTERATDIYSFSHLTFHEYFAAKNILDTSDADHRKAALDRLAGYITEKRWREVFLLVVERMENADYLLTVMLQQINSILAEDEALQRFLNWVSEKATSVDTPYKTASIRAFYLDLSLDRALDLSLDLALNRAENLDRNLDLSLDLALNLNRALNLNPNLDLAENRAKNLDLDLDLSLDLALDLALALNCNLDLFLNRSLTLALNRNLARALNLDLDPELQRALQVLRNQLPPRPQNAEEFEQWWRTQGQAWWRTQGQAWIEKLRAAMNEYRKLGHDWKFSTEQINKLNQYYTANLLLVECLKRADSPKEEEARQRIEDGMLLPMG